MKGLSILLTLALLVLANSLPGWLHRKGALPADNALQERARLAPSARSVPTNLPASYRSIRT